MLLSSGVVVSGVVVGVAAGRLFSVSVVGVVVSGVSCRRRL